MKTLALLAALLRGGAPSLGAATEPDLSGRGGTADLLEPWPVVGKKMKWGWVKGGDCLKHRSKKERRQRNEARRARARNAKR